MPFIAPLTRSCQSSVLTSQSFNEPTLVLSLNRLDIQVVLDQLTEVLWKYEKWGDNLSSRLHDWGLEILLVDPNRLNLNSPELQKKVEAKIIEIRKRILINPLNQQPLISPVVEQDTWEWEESFIMAYKQENKFSPFSQQLIQEYKPHFFAREMLVWLDSFFPRFSSTLPQPLGLEGRATIESENPLSLATLQQIGSPGSVLDHLIETSMVQSYTSRYTLWAFRRELNQQTRICRQKFQEAIALLEQRAEEARRRTEEHERKLNIKLNQVEQTHTEAVHILRTNIEAVKDDLAKANQEKQVFHDTCTKLGSEVQWLRNQVAEAQQQINELRSQDSGFCSIQ